MIWIILAEFGKSPAAVGGLILSVLTYFAGRARGVREREEDRAVRRMQEAEAAGRVPPPSAPPPTALPTAGDDPLLEAL